MVISGDFFDVFDISGDKVGLFICDVMGHGVRAALVAGTPLLLALTPAATARDCLTPDAVPAHLRDLDIPSGCAADYDAWLVEVSA